MANGKDTVSSTPLDLGGMSSPGSQAGMPAPNQPMPPPEAMSPAMAPPTVGGPASPDTGVNPAVPPAPPKGGTPVGTPNPPAHARLLAMVNGLSIGLSAAGTALATHGKEGGAQEVTQIRGEQQQQKIAAQQATAAQKNAALQQRLVTGQINENNARNWLLLQTTPDEISQAHLKTQAEQQGLQAGKISVIGQAQDVRTKALQDFIQTGDKAAYDATLQKLNEAQGAAAPGGTPAAPGTPSAIPPTATATWKNAVDSAISAYPNDPTIQKYASVLADPASSPRDMAMAANGAKNRMSSLDAGVESRTKQEAAAAGGVVAKLSTPEALAAPGSQAAIQAKISDPATSPSDVARLRTLLPQAAVAQFNAETIKQREARNQQIVNQGDPDTAGRMLADKTLTLDELKSRQVTPAFIEAATAAAQKYDSSFQAPVAAAQARAAATPSNQQFFGNTDSLLVHGGTLDQLAQAHASLGNGQIPFFNKLENLRKAATGQGPQAAFAAAELGVADDYSKVISGGAGSDTSRQQAIDIINRDLSPEGMKAAIDQIQKTVQSQRNGRIGTNPYLRSMFPDPSTLQETPGQAGTQKITARGAAAKVHANLNDFTHHFQSAKGTIYSDDGNTWYDANGNLIPGKK